MAIIDKRFLYYTTEAGFLKDKNDGKIDSKSVVFLSENGKRAIYTHGKFFNPEAFVVGTQSSSTNAFTGVFNEIDSLYDGLNIRYWLPYNGTSSAATLNLTIGDTTTGAIPVYIKGTTRFTNHIGGTNVLDLTYRENVGGIEKGWWVLGSYGDAADGNTTYTFTPGTDGSFKVKPSNGSEQTVSIGKPGTAGTADKVEKSFVVQINSGEEEYVSKYTFDGSAAKTINISQGSNISFGIEDGELTINGNYKDATITDSGLMSSDDKEKLDGIEEGANNYEHPSYTEYSSGLYKITVDAEGHVESATKVLKSDITSLGIPAQDTHYESKNVVGSTATSTTDTTSVLSNGSVYLNSIENDVVTSSHKISGKGATTVKTDASGNIEINSPTTIAWGNVTGRPTEFTPSDHEHIISDITDFPETQELRVNGTTYDVYTSETSLPNFYAPSTLGTNGQVLKSDGTKLVWGKDNNDNTWRGITLTDGITDTSVLGTGTDTGALKFKAGNNVSLSASDGVITVSATDTTYDLATSSKAGIVTIGTALAKANGDASAGTTTGGKAAAVDHVHPLQTSVSGNAGTATKLASKVDITLGGDVTGTAEFDGSDDITITTTVGNDSHSHSNSTITSVDASKITSGTISIDRLPHGALERLIVVANDTSRFALTTDNVQLGDTVKVTATGLMYFVKDTDNLANENGYEIYTAGGATSVPWSGITGKPTEFTPSAHDHDAATQSVAGFMSAADKKKLDDIDEGANKYSHPTYTSRAEGLYKITVNGTGHVSAATAVMQSDITGLGIATDDVMTGASSSVDGAKGLVPAPSKGDQNKFLKGDGSWAVPYTHPTYTEVNGKPDADATPGFGGTFTVTDITTNTLGHVTAGTSRTITIPSTTATTSAAGLMSAEDKTKLDYTNIAYGTCSTAAATAAKEITISSNSKWSLTVGSVIVIKFSYTNSASNPTFNVNGTGAKSVWYNTALITTGSLGMAGTANRPMQFMYDGTRFVFIGWSYDTNSTYSTYSLGIGYGTCATAAGTVAKVVTLSNYTLVTGGIVSVKFDNDVPAGATMNINSKGAKAIYHRGAAIATGVIKAGDIATFIYSTNYHLIAIDRATSKATQSVDGLMSSEDKTKLDGIATGATANKGTVTSVTIKNGDGIEVDSTEAITISGTRTISLSESGVTVNTDGSAKTYGNTSQQDPGHSGTFNIPYFTVDKYGRITAASTTTVKLPASGNTDEKVKQSSSTSNLDLPLLVGTTKTPTSGTAYEAYYNTGVTMNPSTRTITATTFSGTLSGNATSATKLKDAQTIDGVGFDGTAEITHYGTCSTAAGTAAKTVVLTGFKLVTGSRIAIKFTVTNTAANPTLNVNSTGAKAIMYRGSAISAGYLAANRVYEFIYDGTDYELIGDINTNTTYSGDRGISLLSGKFGHSNTSIDAKDAFVDTNTPITVSSDGGSFKVTDIKYDTYGHITGSQDRTIKLSEPHKGTVTSVTIEGGTGISVDDSNAITSSGTRTISLNTATTSEIGGMMASNALTTEVTLTSGNGTTANRYYGVQVDKNGKAFVNIPWTDGNTYTSAYSSTAAGTAAKTASCTNYILKNNSWLHITIVNSNTSQGAITLNVNGKGAKPIYINGTASSSSNYTLPAGTYLVYYDGTAYQFNTDGILPGTSSKASTLATSRTLKIGSTGKAFNGSDNVSWSLTEIGAAASSHKHDYTDLTGSGTTANQAIVSDGNANGWKLYTLGSAAGKTASTSISSSSTDSQVPTAKAVYTAITTGIKANDAMIFKGTLGTGGTITALPASHKIGDTYRVITPGSYAGVQCEIGDLIICITKGDAVNNAHWTVAQTNIDGAVTGPTSSTDGHIVVFNGTSGKSIKSSGKTIANLTYSSGTGLSLDNNTFSLAKISGLTSGTYGPSTAVTGSEGSTISVPQITVDDYGRVTGIANKTYTSKNTTYTAGTGLSLSNNSFSLETVTNLTAGDYGNTSQQTPSHGGTFNIPYYTVDDYGRITKAGTTTVKLPGSGNTDTKVNVTLATTSKAYLVGVTTTPTSTATAMTTVSDTGVYLDTTAGMLTATTFKGALSGNASSSTYASNVRITATTTAGTYYPSWTSDIKANTNYVLRGNSNFKYVIVAGTTSAQGYDSIYLGNSTASGTANNSTGRILLYSSSSSYHTLVGAATSSAVAHTLPATTGTILNTGTTSVSATRTSGDLVGTIKINNTETKLYAASNPSLELGTTATTNIAGTLVSSVAVSGHTVTMTKYNGTIGSTTKPAYFDAGVPKECSTYAGGTAVKLNGTSKAASTAEFYAPEAAGTSGQVLVSSGGAPGWKDFDEVGLKTGSVTQAITTLWANIVTANDMATKYCPEAGTYAIQVSGSGIGISSGIFSWNSSGSTDDEILLHRTGASTNIYLRLSSRALQIAGSAAVTSRSISIKVKRLI